MHQRRIFLFIVLPGIVFAELQVIRADSRGVVLKYSPGKMVYSSVNGKISIRFEDADQVAGFGEYDLPAKIVRIGIPQTGAVRLKFNTRQGGVIPNVEPAVVKFIRFNERQADERLSAGDSAVITPSAPVEIGAPEILRSVRFVTLKFNPVQYNRRTGQLVWYQEIEAEFDFDQPARVQTRPDPLDPVVAGMLLNGAEAKDWKVDNARRYGNPYAGFPFWLKITIDSTGIYRITGRELSATGIPLNGIDIKTLSLWTVGRHQPNVSYPDSLSPVAILIRGGDDGRFDLNDTLIFFGLGADHWQDGCSTWFHNLYTDENVYWLTWGRGTGRRMPAGFGPDTTGAPVRWKEKTIVHQEIDADCPARAGLLWLWAAITKPADQPSASFTCELDLKYPVQVERISGQLYNETAQNDITLLFNNRQIAGFRFAESPYPRPYQFTIDTLLPANYSGNSLKITLSGDGEKKIHLDYFEIQYQRRLSLAAGQLHFFVDDTGRYRFRVIDAPYPPYILDVTVPEEPRAVVDYQYRKDTALFSYQIRQRAVFYISTPHQLRTPQKMELKQPGRLWDEHQYADYYIITPRQFISPAQEFARYRNGRVQGINNARVRAVALEDIYDDFGFGLKEPGAIKRFLQHQRPAYVLLVGDATYDYRNNLNRAQSPGVPAYEIGEGFDPEAGDRKTLALDAWYADLEGAGSSPDLILARVTVRSAAEFRQFIQKVIDYENKPAGYWTRRYLLLADDEYLRYPDRPDELRFRHIEQCEGMGALAGNRLDLVKVYLTEFPFMGPKSKPDASRELMRQLNLGALVWVFFGHGSAYALTHEEVLNVQRVADITNGRRLPFAFLGSCSVGRFDDTRQECIAEELVRMTAGAIGSVAASTATPSGNNLVFARSLLTPLLATADTGPTIGVCFYQAWTTDRSYHLFGDPGLVLRMPALSGQPVLVKPETLQAGSRFRVRSISEQTQGSAEWRLFGPRLDRYYRSPLGIWTGYLLSGIEIARGNFRVRDGRFFAQGVFPAGLVRDTIFTGNGYYAPVPGSCRFSGVVQGDSGMTAVLKDGIEFEPRVREQLDSSGPEVTFSYQGQRLHNGAAVPASFELELIFKDEAGILIAPVANLEPALYINDYRTKIGLIDLLVFDDSLFSSCRCRLPVNLNGPVDSITVLVADNLLNRTQARIILKPVPGGVLKIDSVMVYPNPVNGPAFFTFQLNMPAAVRVRVWSLNGRLVRDLGVHNAGFGYNQIFWDGNDQNGRPLSNGVYLYTLTAEFRKGKNEVQRRTVRDKLLVVR
ncbi:MAG: C25 family cysteine peptidase [bacterium]